MLRFFLGAGSKLDVAERIRTVADADIIPDASRMNRSVLDLVVNLGQNKSQLSGRGSPESGPI